MLRTINNHIRSLLFQAHLPPTFWVEALHTVAHILNRLPCKSIGNHTPFFKLYNQHPSYDHIRTFGCLCYPHLHAPHKLAPCSTPCIFLGYPDHHRGYRCYDLNTNKIILSRHVIFYEQTFPYASITPMNPPSYSFLDEGQTPTRSLSFTRHSVTPHHTTPPATPPPAASSSAQQPTSATPSSPPHSTPTASPTRQQSSTDNPFHPASTSRPTRATSALAQSSAPAQLDTAAPSASAQPDTATPSSPDTSTFPPPPTPMHSMVTRSQCGIFKPTNRLNLHTSALSPIPKKSRSSS